MLTIETTDLSKSSIKTSSTIDHDVLRRMIGHIESAITHAEFNEVMKCSKVFVESMRQHIVEEESDTTWFSTVTLMEPRLIPTMEKLKNEHRRLESIADNVLKAYDEKNDDLVIMEMKLCVKLFSQHERTEDSIMQEYIYRDLGTV